MSVVLNRNILAATLLATILMFAWQGFFWMATPFPAQVMKSSTNDAAVVQMLRSHFPVSGVYAVPAMPSNPEDPAYQEQFRNGPLAQIIVDVDGNDPAMKKEMVLGFIHLFLSVLVFAVIVQRVLPSLVTHESRLKFCLAIGVFAAFYSLGQGIWCSASAQFHTMMAIVDMIGWILVSLVLARMLRA